MWIMALGAIPGAEGFMNMGLGCLIQMAAFTQIPTLTGQSKYVLLGVCGFMAGLTVSQFNGGVCVLLLAKASMTVLSYT